MVGAEQVKVNPAWQVLSKAASLLMGRLVDGAAVWPGAQDTPSPSLSFLPCLASLTYRRLLGLLRCLHSLVHMVVCVWAGVP
jgi:hypothetical protein